MTPIASWIDQLVAAQNERHAWLYEAGEKIRRMNEEERANAADAAPRSHASHGAELHRLRPTGFDRFREEQGE